MPVLLPYHLHTTQACAEGASSPFMRHKVLEAPGEKAAKHRMTGRERAKAPAGVVCMGPGSLCVHQAASST